MTGSHLPVGDPMAMGMCRHYNDPIRCEACRIHREEMSRINPMWWWSAFLRARHEAIVILSKDGKSDAEIAAALNLAPGQANSILEATGHPKVPPRPPRRRHARGK